MHYDKESLSMANILGKAGEGQTSKSETVTVRRDNVHRSQGRTFNTEEPAATVEGSNKTQTRPPASEDMPAGRMPTQIGYDLSAHKSRQDESRSLSNNSKSKQMEQASYYSTEQDCSLRP